MNSLYFKGDDVVISADELSAPLRDALLACGQPGEATPAVDYVLETFEIDGNPKDCANYLKPFGAWDDADLKDHQANLRRLVWLTGCSLAEQGVAIISTY